MSQALAGRSGEDAEGHVGLKGTLFLHTSNTDHRKVSRMNFLGTIGQAFGYVLRARVITCRA